MGVLPYSEVVRMFGDPTLFMDEHGDPRPEWELRLTSVPLPRPIPYLDGVRSVKAVRCHSLIAPFLEAAFFTLHRANQWELLKDCGGCYNWRLSRQSNVLSRHSWGIAIDLNVADNPFKGTPKMDPRIVRAFTNEGFTWGGAWKQRRDGMHFEFIDIDRLEAPRGVR
jgi:hypothetical protein